MSQQKRQGRLIHPPPGRRAPAPVHGLARAGVHEIVEQGVARASVAGDGIIAIVHIGDIGDPADIQESHRPHNPRRLDQGPVIDRHHRRPLAPRRHIGGAEVRGDGNAQAISELLPDADLHRQPLAGAMDHRLPVEAHHIHIRRRDAVLLQKPLHRLPVAARDHALTGEDGGWAGLAVGEAHGLIEGGAQ